MWTFRQSPAPFLLRNFGSEPHATKIVCTSKVTHDPEEGVVAEVPAQRVPHAGALVVDVVVEAAGRVEVDLLRVLQLKVNNTHAVCSKNPLAFHAHSRRRRA